MVKIRVRILDDDMEWLRLRSALWPELTPEAQRSEMTNWLARADAVVLVAVRLDDMGLAGFAEVGGRSLADGCETSPVAYLEGWYVDTDMRGQGVGTALIQAAETWAHAHGFREFASDAELDNIESQRAHVALGFLEVGRSVLYLKKL